MNPLLIIGGLGILGFLAMGYKKKSTSPTWEGAAESDPYEGQDYQGSRLPPGFGSNIPTYYHPDADPFDEGGNRFALLPGRLA